MRRAIAAGAILVGLTALAPATAGAADPLRPRQWNLDMVRADEARRTANGTGAVVAVVDTGVQADHPDLQGRLLPGRDFVDDDATPQDGDGHGTHVTGIVVATAGNGVGVESVAPGARVLPVRVLGDDGTGTLRDIIEGIDYAIAQRVDVVNLSLGTDVPISALGLESEFDAAIDRALDRGIVVVAASGNNGLPICEQPSGRGRLICVGSVDRRRGRSFFSSFGQGLSIVAPGGSGLPVEDEDILSTVTRGEYGEYAGTSQATPHVAGVAALLASLGVRGQDAAQRILRTAQDAGTSGPDPFYGAGIVDAAGAVAGLGGGGGTPPPLTGTPAQGAAIIPTPQSLDTVRRKGIGVRCRPATTGRCVVTGTRKGATLASGSRRIAAGRTATVRAPLTRAGRRAAAAGRAFRVRVRVTIPGGRTRKATVTVQP